MKVLFDTNVILDILSKREPYYENSAACLKLCKRQLIGLVAASQTTDIFYLLRRDGYDVPMTKSFLAKLVDNVTIISVSSADVTNALTSKMPDYEDALLAFCGKRHRAEYIITRNEKDFLFSPIPAKSPEAFLTQFFSE